MGYPGRFLCQLTNCTESKVKCEKKLPNMHNGSATAVTKMSARTIFMMNSFLTALSDFDVKYADNVTIFPKIPAKCVYTDNFFSVNRMTFQNYNSL